ncbi:MAG: PQQ-binding-like beta-propeller repeat protein [Verrucomicrobia bacterium]|nr:PQQ-binding-like beta-propeller repeat protein [Verrucomicrobiota bacterium]
MRQLALVLFASLALTPLARAADWPEFRGPTHDGLSTERGLPISWSATNGAPMKNIAWKIPLPGGGWSSPVVVKGKIYLTTAVSETGQSGLSLRVLCLDAKRGGTLWNTEVIHREEGVKHHRKNSDASPTPIIEGDRLYAHFGHYGTACLDLAGKVVWKNTELEYSPVHGNGGSPALTPRALVFSCDGRDAPFVVALDKLTGKVLWKTARVTDAKKKFAFSTPLVIQAGNRTEVISPGSGAVCAYDPQTGKELWRARYGEGYSVVPRPVFGHGLLFLSSGFDQPVLLAIRPGGAGDVTDSHVAWKLDKGAPKSPSPLLVGNELYLVSDAGIASCVDAKTGAVHWSERLGGDFSASPIYADGKVYFQNETGTGYVVAAEKQFKLLAQNALGEKTLASYAAADGALFIRGEANLYRVQGK